MPRITDAPFPPLFTDIFILIPTAALLLAGPPADEIAGFPQANEIAGRPQQTRSPFSSRPQQEQRGRGGDPLGEQEQIESGWLPRRAGEEGGDSLGEHVGKKGGESLGEQRARCGEEERRRGEKDRGRGKTIEFEIQTERLGVQTYFHCVF
jgi:hypothetical protein